mgnify:CR=1 FL=1
MTTYKIHEVAKKLGVTVKTLQRWDNSGVFKARRTPTNHRYYTDEDILKYQGLSLDKPKRKTVAYVRVSSCGQTLDLKRQIEFIRNFVNAKGEILDEVFEEVDSGLNYTRPKWNELLQAVMRDEINKIYITYRDRFVRFGFDWFESLCNQHQTEIIVLNNETTSPEKEIVEDLTSIIDDFSCRLSGLRKYKKILKEDKEVLTNETNSQSSS